MPLPIVPFSGSELPGSANAAPAAGRLSGASPSDVITPVLPLTGNAEQAASGKPMLVAAPLPDLVLRTDPDAGPALNDPTADPVPAMSLASGGERAVSGKPMLAAAPLPDLVLRTDPDAGPTLGDPAPVNAPPVVVPQSVDSTTAPTPTPTPTPTGVDVAKPSAPRKPAMAPAPVPMVFAPAQTSPVVAPVAVKGAGAPVEPAPVEDGASADAEDIDPAATAFPQMTALPPLLPDIAAAPLPEAAAATPDTSADTDPGSSKQDAPMTAPVAPGATPALGQPPAISGKVEVAASADHPAAVAATGLRPVREEAAPADQKPVTAATPDPRSFAALVEPKVVTPAPAPMATAASPVPEARVAAERGRMGHEMAVAIARHTAEGGGEALTVRLNPAEFGRIDVTLSFDDRGTLRAVLAAETPAALDLLRRDSADLGRALSDAGMRTDAQSFRFDTRQGGADAGGQGAQGQPRWQAAATPRNASTTTDLPEPEYRPLRSRGGVDLMA
ncbi:flagellar hook-length control protein FliK [Sphingomonas cynarae]|uniref:flagellar hook-length control protein FliK n=1 Tax=Sphingomonas cynarae TaxID=930197 RepID=UPI0031D47026